MELKVLLATPHPKMKNACDGAIEVYPKSEADKVIAELKDKLRHYPFMEAMLEHDKLVILAHKNIIHHHKYKRCLAMANLCHWKSAVFIYKKDKNDFYWRWYKRWLKIAEQINEAK